MEQSEEITEQEEFEHLVHQQTTEIVNSLSGSNLWRANLNDIKQTIREAGDSI